MLDVASAAAARYFVSFLRSCGFANLAWYLSGCSSRDSIASDGGVPDAALTPGLTIAAAAARVTVERARTFVASEPASYAVAEAGAAPSTRRGSTLPLRRPAVDGVGKDARFSGAMGIATDRAGHAFVAEWRNGTVRELDLATGRVTTVIGVAGQHGLALGTTTERLNRPTAVAVPPDGDLLVTDEAESAVVRWRW